MFPVEVGLHHCSDRRVEIDVQVQQYIDVGVDSIDVDQGAQVLLPPPFNVSVLMLVPVIGPVSTASVPAPDTNPFGVGTVP